MQLVVMAVLLALAKVGQGCSFSCHLKNVIIPVQSCGTTTNITTTICEGRCYHQDPVYINYVDQPKYNSCNGEWTYEMKYIDGCEVGVPFLVARSCDCTTCNPENTDCGRLHAEIPNC